MDVISRADARAQGLPRYYTGAPCQRGHISERYVKKGECCVCKNNNRMAAYYANYEAERERGKRDQKRRSSTEKYKAKKKIHDKTYSDKNREKILQRKRDYYREKRASGYFEREDVKQAARERSRDCRRRNLEKYKIREREQKKIHRNYYLAQLALRTARKKQAAPLWLTEEQKKEIKDIYKNRPPGYHVDHIVPIKGKTVCGLHVPWNLQYLTAEENYTKGNKWTP